MFHRVIDRMENHELSRQTQSKSYLKHNFLYSTIPFDTIEKSVWLLETT